MTKITTHKDNFLMKMKGGKLVSHGSFLTFHTVPHGNGARVVVPSEQELGTLNSKRVRPALVRRQMRKMIAAKGLPGSRHDIDRAHREMLIQDGVNPAIAWAEYFMDVAEGSLTRLWFYFKRVK